MAVNIVQLFDNVCIQCTLSYLNKLNNTCYLNLSIVDKENNKASLRWYIISATLDVFGLF